VITPYTNSKQLFLLLLIFSSLLVKGQTSSKAEVIRIIHKVNNHWQETNPEPGWAFWNHTAYHTGNMEAYYITGEEKFREYTERWANHNEWKGAKSDDKKEWKYSYGETDDYVLFGDWQACFQVYADLYLLDPQEYKIARAREVLEYQMGTLRNDYWWWADGIYMTMPVMTRLYKITKNPLYLEKLDEYLEYTDNIMYDKQSHLYYRDAGFIYPKHKTINGKKDFWSRGDGWIFAAFARSLHDIPSMDSNRKKYAKRFRDMAGAIKDCQQPEGYWTRSMLDPEYVPGPETSGTAFYVYGLFWGINNGYLEKDLYLEAAIKGWKYLEEVALQPDGTVGYIQPIGDRAIPGQAIDKASTANFGVGAFLLAACEYVRYLDGRR